jgi:SAM-dependent methyltransferase
MTASAPAEVVCDYDGFDFPSLWRGRSKVTEVEQGLLGGMLATVDRRRVLEVGTGFGRLLGSIEAVSEEVVATDFDRGSLARLGGPPAGKRPTLRVAANIYHLPFVDGAFSAATLIRVYHHLSDPARALGELRRVLSPGGHLIASYNPRPTVGTLVNDVQRALHPSSEVAFHSITFHRGPHVELPPDPFPVHVGPRSEFHDTARAVGFALEGERVSGLEEYYLMRYVPARWFVQVGTALGRLPGFPMRFAVLAVPGAPPGPRPLPSEILVCPACRAPIRPVDGDPEVACPGCPFSGELRDGVLDLRYVPEGTPRFAGGRAHG